MKKLFIVITILAIAVSFLPKVEAAETAELSLQVTFKPIPEIRMYASPQGPHEIEEGDSLSIHVTAECWNVYYSEGIELTAENLPEGAEWELYRISVSCKNRNCIA